MAHAQAFSLPSFPSDVHDQDDREDRAVSLLSGVDKHEKAPLYIYAKQRQVISKMQLDGIIHEAVSAAVRFHHEKKSARED